MCTRIDAIIMLVLVGIDKTSWSPLTFMVETKKKVISMQKLQGKYKMRKLKEKEKEKMIW